MSEMKRRGIRGVRERDVKKEGKKGWNVPRFLSTVYLEPSMHRSALSQPAPTSLGLPCVSIQKEKTK